MIKDKLFNIRTNSEKYEKFKAKAFEDYTNASEVINMMIDMYLNGQVKFEKSKLVLTDQKLPEH